MFSSRNSRNSASFAHWTFVRQHMIFLITEGRRSRPAAPVLRGQRLHMLSVQSRRKVSFASSTLGSCHPLWFQNRSGHTTPFDHSMTTAFATRPYAPHPTCIPHVFASDDHRSPSSTGNMLREKTFGHTTNHRESEQAGKTTNQHKQKCFWVSSRKRPG